MYAINDTQIDFIRSDIRARGVEMVSLQQDLLDHICCVIEQELDEDGDFERCYERVVARFYKKELREIQEETIHLLTHKNYYVMKKVMLASGAASTGLLLVGMIFKFLHWPGAAACLVLGVVLLSLVFLPLMFTLKVREQREKSDKIVAAAGTLAGILMSLGVLFKVMHWPGANVMCGVALLVTMLVFLPVYFFSGIRNPQTKVNTIVSSVLLFAGCALILILVRAPGASKNEYVRYTDYFVRNQRIVALEAELLAQNGGSSGTAADAATIIRLCDELKTFLIERETGLKKLDGDFEQKGAWIGETFASVYWADAPAERAKLDKIRQYVSQFNDGHRATMGFEPISIGERSLDPTDRVRNLLNELSQIQLMVLQNQRRLLAAK